MKELKGAIALIPTPLTDQGRVDEKGMRDLIDYDMAGGCHGVGVMGAIGEGYLVTEKARETIIKIAARHVNGRGPLIVGCPSMGTLHAVDLCKQAEQLGADAILAFNPQGFRPYKEEELVDHYLSLADTVNINVIPYARLNDELPFGVMKRLVDSGKFSYLKYGCHSCDQLKQFVDGLGDKLFIFVGTDNFTLRHLLLGANGLSTATCAVFPEENVTLLSLVQAGRIEEARQYYNDMIVPWNDCAFYQNWQAVHKYALVRLGIIKSPKCLPPQAPLSDYQIEEIKWLIDHRKQHESTTSHPH